ncbi:MAG: peptidoglycan-binding protein [Paracoccaceae bacterium]
MRHLLLTTALTMGIVSAARAQDVALVVGNENYSNASDISAATDALDAVRALARAGLAVREDGDLDIGGLRTIVAEFYDDLKGARSGAVLLSGHFVHAGGETWFLGTDADAPTLASADAEGLALDTLMRILADLPAGGIMLLGTEDRRISLGRGLERGIGPLDIPQGVTVFRGDAADIAAFADRIVSQRGLSAADLAANGDGLLAEGYLGDLAPFLPLEGLQAAPPAEDQPAIERAIWEAAVAGNTRQGYEAYLKRFPDGTFAVPARKAIADLSDPAAMARAEEDALRLNRDQRRQIQRDLSILDIDPRGIDGLFGPGSRNAINTWQRRNGNEPTGYITGRQIATLAAQAEKRAAELEAEAAARQVEQDRQDRQYWEQTGRAGDEPGLRAYLKRYPDGLFAELAQERLKVFDDERRQQAQAADRATWDEAVRLNTADSYRGYLRAYPQGAFVEEAQQRIAELTADAGQAEEISRAERAEAALGLNPAVSRVLEQRLAALGLKPGPVDGVFDKDTRRAIRRYQRARSLPVTGYLNQQTVARLLVDSL